MVWQLERNHDTLTCEIREARNSDGYEFVVSSRTEPPRTLRYRSPTELIDGFLQAGSALEAEGWQPLRKRWPQGGGGSVAQLFQP